MKGSMIGKWLSCRAAGGIKSYAVQYNNNNNTGCVLFAGPLHDLTISVVLRSVFCVGCRFAVFPAVQGNGC